MNNSLLPELWCKTIHKECCKGKNTEAIVGINGVKSVFLYAQLQLESLSGAGKQINFKNSDFLSLYYNRE